MGRPGNVSYFQSSKLACFTFIDVGRDNKILSIRQRAL